MGKAGTQTKPPNGLILPNFSKAARAGASALTCTSSHANSNLSPTRSGSELLQNNYRNSPKFGPQLLSTLTNGQWNHPGCPEALLTLDHVSLWPLQYLSSCRLFSVSLLALHLCLPLTVFPFTDKRLRSPHRFFPLLPHPQSSPPPPPAPINTSPPKLSVEDATDLLIVKSSGHVPVPSGPLPHLGLHHKPCHSAISSAHSFASTSLSPAPGPFVSAGRSPPASLCLIHILPGVSQHNIPYMMLSSSALVVS